MNGRRRQLMVVKAYNPNNPASSPAIPFIETSAPLVEKISLPAAGPALLYPSTNITR